MRERLTLSGREQQRITIVTRWFAGVIGSDDAVALLGTSERTAWRLRAALLARGPDGLGHGNRGRPSPRRLAADDRDGILALAQTTLAGYNDTHMGEAL